MMDKTNRSIDVIVKKSIMRSLKQLTQRPGLLFDHREVESIINKRIETKNYIWQECEGQFSTNILCAFLRSPQINDLLDSYLQLLLLKSITGVPSKKVIERDNILIYLVKIVEDHFDKLIKNNNEKLVYIFFETIFEICSENFSFAFDSHLEQSGDVTIEGLHRVLLEERGIHLELTNKIDYFLESKYIPVNLDFEQMGKKYSKSIRQLYQTGFIYLLGEYKFNDFYIPPVLSCKEDGMGLPGFSLLRYMSESMAEHRDWKNIFNNSDIVYIVGGAGYGKSLFLRNIINNQVKMAFSNSTDYLIIFCDLKSFYTNGNGNGKSIIGFFEESMINSTGIDSISKDMIQYYLDIGRCLILLDALDEVPKTVRHELHKKMVVFFKNQNPNNKICITSRDRGFIPQEKIEAIQILPLTENDIENYLDKMIELKKFKKNDKDMFLEQAKILIEKDFLNNFLILSLLVNIFKSEKALPENKIDLYKKCFEYIAKKREEEKSKTGYNWSTIFPLMKDSTFISLAVLSAPNNSDIHRSVIEERLLKQYKMKYADEATAERAISEFLEFCSNRTELFIPASVDDKYKFFHRSFFEYFYSRYIYQQGKIEKMYELMSSFDVDSEIFELTVALTKEDQEEKYQKLIEYIIQKADEEFSVEPPAITAFTILTLAMQVVDDAHYFEEYYNLLLKHHMLLSRRLGSRLNQKLVASWLEKAIEEDKEKRTRFRKTYRPHCLYYVLDKLSLPQNESITRRLLLSVTSRRLPGIDYRSEELTSPFYLNQFVENGSLFDFIEKETDVPFSTFMAKLNMPLNKRERNSLKSGFEAYKKMSKHERESFLTMPLGSQISITEYSPLLQSLF